VRVIRGPAEFGKIRRGDVLVAPVTAPAWTPLFALAAAVVTETGGALSHAAIVAREYGIPAVLAVKRATSLLADGDHVVVDGNAGWVDRDVRETPVGTAAARRGMGLASELEAPGREEKT
jgi:pyruvate,water dikinase